VFEPTPADRVFSLARSSRHLSRPPTWHHPHAGMEPRVYPPGVRLRIACGNGLVVQFEARKDDTSEVSKARTAPSLVSCAVRQGFSFVLTDSSSESVKWRWTPSWKARPRRAPS
jgi:hypothetical protein